MIDTKALRSKVLDLAIQGKLTQQLESDGTAEELYQQIQEEKQKLIKEGKIKKEKVLPPVSEEEIPFEIPRNWKWVRLGEIVTVLGGKRIPAGRKLTTEDTGHKYIRVSDMKNMSVDTSGLLFVPEDIYPSISQYIINKEDIYITVAGTIGRVGTIPDEIDGANLTENADRLVFTSLYRNWLVYCLSDDTVQKQIMFLTTQVAQPKLAIKKIQEFYIPLPPLAEQKRIVGRVEEIFKLLDIIDEAQKKYSADAEILKSKLITMGIQGKLTKQLDSDGTAEELFEQIQNEKQKLIKEKKIPKEQKLPSISKEEISFNIPCNWKWVRVQDIATYITDYVANGSFATLKAHTKTYKEPNYALFVRTMDLSCNFSETCSYIDKESYDFLSKSQLFGGELILPNIGASIGKAFIMPNLNMPMSLAPNSILLKFTDTSMNKYFSYIVKSSFGQNLLTKSQGGSATAKFSKTDLRKLVVPLPPLAEQKRIADTLDEVLRVIG
ncbi:MAG: restriction endonuclease subunit S [Ruminococcus callidus]|nr:restriction endonuclease subunit S [Ruminococcus callidus]